MRWKRKRRMMKMDTKDTLPAIRISCFDIENLIFSPLCFYSYLFFFDPIFFLIQIFFFHVKIENFYQKKKTSPRFVPARVSRILFLNFYRFRIILFFLSKTSIAKEVDQSVQFLFSHFPSLLTKIMYRAIG